MNTRCLFKHDWEPVENWRAEYNFMIPEDDNPWPTRRCSHCGRVDMWHPGSGGHNPVTGKPWVVLGHWTRD